MSDLFGGWTTDADGNYIDWTRPPYYRAGVVNLLLPGETSISFETLAKRSQEYLKLTRRAMARRKRDGR